MRTFAAAAFAGLVAATPMSEVEYKFISFIAKYGKMYETREEYAFRFQQFAAVDAEIVRLNATQKDSRHGHNIFSDLSRAEYKQKLGYLPAFT